MGKPLAGAGAKKRNHVQNGQLGEARVRARSNNGTEQQQQNEAQTKQWYRHV